MALNPGFDLSMKRTTDRLLPYIFTSVFYYIGYMLLSKIDAYPVFKVFMLASVLVIVGLLLVSLKWKISAQMAAIGGVTGALLSLSFRTGISPVWAIMLVIAVSGLIGSISLLQEKHSIGQIVAGYFLGFSVIYLVLYYI